jgi:hypothetical protein
MNNLYETLRARALGFVRKSARTPFRAIPLRNTLYLNASPIHRDDILQGLLTRSRSRNGKRGGAGLPLKGRRNQCSLVGTKVTAAVGQNPNRNFKALYLLLFPLVRSSYRSFCFTKKYLAFIAYIKAFFTM